MNNMHTSMNIGRTLDCNQIKLRKCLYRPIELQLKENGGLSVVKTFQGTIEYEKYYDQRKSMDLLTDVNMIGKGEKKKEKNNLKQTKIFEQADDKASQILTQYFQDQFQTRNIMNAEEYQQFIDNAIKFKLGSASHGLLSIIASSSKTVENKLKALICVTMFKERRGQLTQTLNGIYSNLDEFTKHGIATHQLGVCVFFDGIENIHNSQDVNGGSYEDDIIPFFSQQFDAVSKFPECKTLHYQYLTYRKHKKRIHDYSDENLKIFENDPKQMSQKLEKDWDFLKASMEKLKKDYTTGDLMVPKYVIEHMKKLRAISQKYIDARENTAWVYQTDYKHKESGGILPVFYVFKFKNGQKLSSHMWFFKGFCQELQPEYCMLMDCGAVPDKDSIFKLVMQMDAQPQVGGVCGNMRIMEDYDQPDLSYSMDILSQILNTKLFSIQKCQSCEYDIGHVLDKQFESVLNYIHVLPGAFSGYRYKALTENYYQEKINQEALNNRRAANQQIQGVENTSLLQQQVKQNNVQLNNQNNNQINNQINIQSNNQLNIQSNGQLNNQIIIQNDNQNNRKELKNIIDKYLKQVIDKNHQYESLAEANMYLAEDRVLCSLIFCNGYYLRFVSDAYVYVDAPPTLIELLNQRRRWINGSWFALNFVIANHQEDLEKSRHSQWDKLWFRFSLAQARISQVAMYLYQTFQLIWIYMILDYAVETGDQDTDFIIKSIILGIYIFLIFTLIFLSLTYRPEILKNLSPEKQNEVKTYYYSKFYGISTLLGVISLGTVVYTIYLLIQEIFISSTLKEFVDKPDVPQSYYFLLIVISLGMTGLPFIFTVFISYQVFFNVLLNVIHYLFFQPTYTHLFLLFAFCRIDDLSWGTKGLDVVGEEKKMTKRKELSKFEFLALWLLVNSFLSIFIIILLQLSSTLIPQCLILGLSVLLTSLQIIKGLLAMIYQCRFKFHHKAERTRYIAAQVNSAGEKIHEKSKQFNNKIESLLDKMYVDERNDNQQSQQQLQQHRPQQQQQRQQ